MELEVKESIKLEEGKREGLIENITYRDIEIKGKKVTYADIEIKDKESGITLRYGASAYISEKSKLGKVLANFIEIKTGLKIDPEKILVGKEVTYMTMNEKTDNGEFVKIVDNSIKPK